MMAIHQRLGWIVFPSTIANKIEDGLALAIVTVKQKIKTSISKYEAEVKFYLKLIVMIERP